MENPSNYTPYLQAKRNIVLQTVCGAGVSWKRTDGVNRLSKGTLIPERRDIGNNHVGK